MPTKPSDVINELQCPSALGDARRLLQYWQNEHANAVASKDELRAEKCNRFVAQCELVAAALERAQVGVADRPSPNQWLP